MGTRIAGLPVPGPSDLLAGARAVVGWTGDAVEVAGALPERALRLVDGVEGLVGRIAVIADRVELLLDRVDGIADDADELIGSVRTVAGSAAGLVARAEQVAGDAARLVARADEVAAGAATVVAGAGQVAGRAAEVVDEAAGTSAVAGELVATYAPIAKRVAPLADRFVAELSEQEVLAAIRLVDQLPQLTEHLESDIMPILATLDRVGPDVHELLDVLKEVRQAIIGIPGFAFFRRRGERDEEERAE